MASITVTVARVQRLKHVKVPNFSDALVHITAVNVRQCFKDSVRQHGQIPSCKGETGESDVGIPILLV